MLVSIHLVARLLRVPLLRIDGDIVLVDDDRLGSPTSSGVSHRQQHELSAGRLLALAEAELAAVDERRRRRTTAGA